MKKNMNKQSKTEAKSTNKVTNCNRSNVTNKTNNKITNKSNSNLGFDDESRSFELDDNDDHSFELK